MRQELNDLLNEYSNSIIVKTYLPPIRLRKVMTILRSLFGSRSENVHRDLSGPTDLGSRWLFVFAWNIDRYSPTNENKTISCFRMEMKSPEMRKQRFVPWEPRKAAVGPEGGGQAPSSLPPLFAYSLPKLDPISTLTIENEEERRAGDGAEQVAEGNPDKGMQNREKSVTPGTIGER